MKSDLIHVICGTGKGKTSCAVGRALTAILSNETVIMIQFMKGALNDTNKKILARLEPEFKVFRFEKSAEPFDRLSAPEREEARSCIKNGMNFARKVLKTGECNVLILDELLGILDEKIITQDDVLAIIKQARGSGVQLILTGVTYPSSLNPYVDVITALDTKCN